MNKINERIESIFAHAVAMEQSGRMKSSIYCIGSDIFILNAENTVLLRFLLRKTEAPFENPVSFRANDYDSRNFYEKDGKIIFVTENSSFVRTKSCATPGVTPQEVKELFSSYKKINDNTVKISSDVLPLLDDSLSHIEISAPGKNLEIVQRNIYNGSVLRLERKKGEGLGNLLVDDEITDEFGPIGMRTNDFAALFAFIDSLKFGFPSGEIDYCYIRTMDLKMAMEGIIATCLYDELGSVEISRKGENDGREKQEVRGSVGGADCKTDQRKRSCRKR